SVATFDKLAAGTAPEPVLRLRSSTVASSARTSCTSRAAGRACSPCAFPTMNVPMSASPPRPRAATPVPSLAPGGAGAAAAGVGETGGAEGGAADAGLVTAADAAEAALPGPEVALPGTEMGGPLLPAAELPAAVSGGWARCDCLPANAAAASA